MYAKIVTFFLHEIFRESFDFPTMDSVKSNFKTSHWFQGEEMKEWYVVVCVEAFTVVMS